MLLPHSEIYKIPRPHEVDVPRTWDVAEIKRGHCRANEDAGRLVQVVGEPHLCFCMCAYCGTDVTEYFVEVHCSDPQWMKVPGPWFMPLRWLKRLDPRDPVNYQRIRDYRPLAPTPEQILEANPELKRSGVTLEQLIASEPIG